MVINISVHNGWFLPDIILLTQGYYHWGTRLDTMYVVALYLQPTYVIVYYYYQCLIVYYIVSVCFYCFPGVPSWRLM